MLSVALASTRIVALGTYFRNIKKSWSDAISSTSELVFLTPYIHTSKRSCSTMKHLARATHAIELALMQLFFTQPHAFEPHHWIGLRVIGTLLSHHDEQRMSQRHHYLLANKCALKSLKMVEYVQYQKACALYHFLFFSSSWTIYFVTFFSTCSMPSKKFFLFENARWNTVFTSHSHHL